MFRNILFLAEVLKIISLLVPTIVANEIYVSPSGFNNENCGNATYPCSNVRIALIKSVTGDVLLLKAGRYFGNDNRNLTISKILSIRSESGPQETIIDLQGYGPAFIIEVFISFKGITFANGLTSYGGCIQLTVNSSSHFEDCIFHNNTAISSLSTVKNGNSYSSISINSASGKGGAIYSDDGSRMVISDCIFMNNRADISGGSLRMNSHSRVQIISTEFRENRAGSFGGAVSITNTVMEMSNVSFIRNLAVGSGGALAIDYSSAVFGEVVSMEDNRCERQEGGAVFCRDSSHLSFLQSLFIHNIAFGGVGGAFMLDSNCGLILGEWTEFRSNIAGNHGGALFVYNGAMLNASKTIFIDNIAGNNGGALLLEASSKASIDQCNFTRNSAFQGAGLFLQYRSELRIQKSSFLNNSALHVAPGIYCSGSSVIINSTQFRDRTMMSKSETLLTSSTSFSPFHELRSYVGEDDGVYCSSQPAGSSCVVRGDDGTWLNECGLADFTTGNENENSFLSFASVIGIALGGLGFVVCCVFCALCYSWRKEHLKEERLGWKRIPIEIDSDMLELSETYDEEIKPRKVRFAEVQMEENES